MEYELYCIFDVATNSFGVPMAQENDSTAMRSFAHEAMKPDSVWNSHPEDFSLYKVGIYNCDTAEISGYNQPQLICRALDFVSKKKKGTK